MVPGIDPSQHVLMAVDHMTGNHGPRDPLISFVPWGGGHKDESPSGDFL